MPLQDNTYIVYAPQTTPLAWPPGARIAQVRFIALDTTASVIFQANAGTPILEWRLLDTGSARSLIPLYHSYPMYGVRFPTAWIPTTLTACTAWIDFC